MNRIKCNDYYIIKICYYADKYLTHRFDDKYYDKVSKDPVVIKQHWERAGLYHDFKSKYIEHLTGKPIKDWLFDYMYEPYECAFEDIYEKYGIISAVCTEGWYYYYIPKTLPDIFEWVKDNLVSPYKVVSKTKWIPMVQSNLNWHRTESIEFTQKMKDDFSELKNIKRT